MSADNVQLLVNSRVYGGWESVEITRSIETMAGSFSLKVAERWAGQQVIAQIIPGDQCQLTIDGSPVITGWVDDVAFEYDEKSHEVTVTGRDAAGDLVDCSAPYIGGQKFNADVVGLISDIARPFGINVRSDIEGLAPIPEFVIHPGQKAGEAIAQICSFAALLPVSDGLGNLVLTRGGLSGAQAPLKLGKNIRKASGKFSAKDRYQTYQVLGQANGSGNVDPAAAVGGNGSSTDAGVTRHRPLIIIADFMAVGNEAYQRRALWEQTVRAGREFSATHTVKGWRDDAGMLWNPNATVRVDDDFAGIHDTMLVSGVHFSQTLAGTTTALTITRPQAFDLIPMPLDSGIYDATPTGHPVAGKG
jgi:prophage tail gpP-like protein